METVEKVQDAPVVVDRVAEIAKVEVAKIEKEATEAVEKAKTTPPVTGEPKDAPADSSAEKEKIEVNEVDKVKHSMQKRIDELTKEKNEEKEKRETDSKKVAEMEKELADLKETLKANKAIPSDEDIEEEKQSTLIEKFIAEDSEKDREKRREMSEDDLEEWLLEDYSKATQWIIKRDIRRAKEEEKVPETKSTDDLDKVHVEAREKLTAKYPGTVMKERAAELQKEGKTNEQITLQLRKESKEFDMMMEIVESDPAKYTKVANGPELVMLEMDKRLTKDTKKTYTAEEVEQIKKETAEMERKRLAGLDSSFGDSGSGGSGPKGGESLPSGYSEKGLEVFLKSDKKWTRKDYIDTLKRRETIEGANVL